MISCTLQRKHLFSLECAYDLFDEDTLEEVAELGLPEAQGKMAPRYCRGRLHVTGSAEWRWRA